MNLSVLIITCAACAILSKTEGLIPQPRCLCTKMVTWKIPDDRIVKIEIFKPGPHCKNTEIIATVQKLEKKLSLCLNPKHKWVHKAVKRRKLAS